MSDGKQRESMDQTVAKALNASGYPFQEAVLRRLESVFDARPDWHFIASELPVQVASADARIDFVLGRWRRSFEPDCAYVVAECKRANPALGRWIFAGTAPRWRSASASDLIVETVFRNAPSLEPGWLVAGCLTREVSEPGYSIAVEARAGQDGDARGDGRGAIEKAATQVMRGVNGLVETLDRDVAQLPRNAHVPLIPVIFTTAELWSTDADLGAADRATGELNVEAIGARRRTWLWFQYHTSHGLQHAASRWYKPDGSGMASALGKLIHDRYARSVAIVHPDGIDDFFANGLAGF